MGGFGTRMGPMKFYSNMSPSLNLKSKRKRFGTLNEARDT